MLQDIRRAVSAVPDPELPMVSIADLGILREVTESDGTVTVVVTPTYSGCPAMDAIRDDVRTAAIAAGATEVVIRTVLSPPWTTDWLTDTAHRILAENGIAPPQPQAAPSGVPLALSIRCPQCGSLATEQSSQFGATACTALHRCRECLEPFTHMKAI